MLRINSRKWCINDKWNFINRETGDLVSNTWYDAVCDFREGFAIVRKNRGLLSNFIDTAGNLISDTWYSNCCDFCNGFAKVYENRKWSFIDKQGNQYEVDQFGYVKQCEQKSF